jgi:hypothetical protein
MRFAPLSLLSLAAFFLFDSGESRASDGATSGCATSDGGTTGCGWCHGGRLGCGWPACGLFGFGWGSEADYPPSQVCDHCWGGPYWCLNRCFPFYTGFYGSPYNQKSPPLPLLRSGAVDNYRSSLRMMGVETPDNPSPVRAASDEPK